MKPDYLTAEVTAERPDDAVEKALEQLGFTRTKANSEVFQLHSSGLTGRFGKHPVLRVYHRVRQSVRPLSPPPCNFSKRQILSDLCKHETGHEYRSKSHAGDHTVVVLQKRG